MKRHKHDLSHYKLLSGMMGKLIPVQLIETLPGDTFKGSTSVVMRCSPLIAPPMHPTILRVHHFFVPHRLVWDKFPKWITGEDTVDNPPTLTLNGTVGYLGDYFGLPTGVSGLTVSALPFYGYNLIHNEFFRDQEIQSETALNNQVPLYIDWEKDYFTTCRPEPQRGASVLLPLGDSAPVRGIGAANGTFAHNSVSVRETDGTGSVTYAHAKQLNATAAPPQDDVYLEEDPNNTGFPNIWADLSAATAASVTALRKALALERILEKRSRYGNRYSEVIQSEFGIIPEDARIQRPEYLGGGRQSVQFSEVLQTTQGNSGPATDLGRMGGHGISLARSNRFTYFAREHGYIFTLISVRPVPVYQQGIARNWTRATKEDFYWPELELIGQQPVLNQELRADGTSQDTDVFGYNNRYEEYRREPSRVAGQFRNSGIYHYWNFARWFGGAQALNSSFLKCIPTTDPFADTSDDVLLFMVNNHTFAKRIVKRNPQPRII